jgi:hypothetical protein
VFGVVVAFAWPCREMGKGNLFDGVVFSTAGNLSRSTLDITKAVKENGGAVSYLITKKVTIKIFSVQFLWTNTNNILHS